MPDPILLSVKERQAVSRLRQILIDPCFLRANWVKMVHPCGRSSCRCAKKKAYWHVSWYVSQSWKGKPRMKCVPQEQMPQVQNWVRSYKEAARLLTSLGNGSWERIGKKEDKKRKKK